MGWIIALAAAVFTLKEAKEITPFDSLFQKIANKWKFDWVLFKAIARVESSFNPHAINSITNDYGLMQINVSNWKFVGMNEANWGDPEVNVEAAGKLLDDMRRTLSGRYNVLALISSYNQGPGNYLKNGLKNIEYVSKVVFYWSMYSIQNQLT